MDRGNWMVAVQKKDEPLGTYNTSGRHYNRQVGPLLYKPNGPRGAGGGIVKTHWTSGQHPLAHPFHWLPRKQDAEG